MDAEMAMTETRVDPNRAACRFGNPDGNHRHRHIYPTPNYRFRFEFSCPKPRR